MNTMNMENVRRVTVTNWGGESETVMLFHNINKFNNGDSFIFKQGPSGEFKMYFFILENVSENFGSLLNEITHDYSLVDACQDTLVMKGDIINSKIILTESSFTQNYKGQSIYFELLCLGHALNSLYNFNLDLSFISETFGYNRPVVIQREEKKYISLLTTNDILVDVAPDKSESSKAKYYFEFKGLLNQRPIHGSLALNKEIYQMDDWLDSALSYFDLWDLYFVHEIVNNLAIQSNEDIPDFNNWKESFVSELDQDFWNHGIIY